MYPLPEAKQHGTSHARAVRRAIRQMRAAKALGDDRLASIYQQAAKQALDLHLAEYRAQRP